MTHRTSVRRVGIATTFLAMTVLATPALSQIGEYDFVIQSTTSGLSGSLSSGIATTGTLIGNYDQTANPTGTRTKPGVFGSFGATENVPVDISLGAGLNGDLQTRSAGGFRLDIDTVTGQLLVENYEVNFLSAGPLEVPVTVALEYDTFRTRNPTSTYIGGFPLQLPIGQVSVTAFSVRQVGPSIGTVVPADGGGYTFLVAPLVEISLAFSLLGNEFVLPTTTIPFALGGDLSFNGTSAQVDSLNPLAFDQSFEINQVLPEQAFDLPTILPPGGNASVLFNLTLNSIFANLDAQVETHASGQLIPSPSSVALLGLAFVYGTRRRR